MRMVPGIDLAQASQQVPNSPKHSSGNKTSHSQQGIWLWPPFFFSESTACTQAFPWQLASKPGNGRIMYCHWWDYTLPDETWEKNDVLNRNFRTSSYATSSDFIVSTYMSDILPKNFISGNKWFKYFILTGFLNFYFHFYFSFYLPFC